MRSRGVLLSLVLHGALAAGLLQVSARRARHRAIAVATVDAKKKAAPKPPKPVPPKPIVRPPASHPAPAAKAAPALVPVRVEPAAKAAPMDLHDLVMSSDAGSGIALGGPARTLAAAPRPAAAQATRKIASLGSRVPARDPLTGREACAEEATKPIPIQKTEIEYTNEARATGVEGRLVLRLVIAADGSVQEVQVQSGVDPALDAAAVAVVKRWQFRPAMLCGKPIDGGVYTLARRFELGD